MPVSSWILIYLNRNCFPKPSLSRVVTSAVDEWGIRDHGCPNAEFSTILWIINDTLHCTGKDVQISSNFLWGILVYFKHFNAVLWYLFRQWSSSAHFYSSKTQAFMDASFAPNHHHINLLITWFKSFFSLFTTLLALNCSHYNFFMDYVTVIKCKKGIDIKRNKDDVEKMILQRNARITFSLLNLYCFAIASVALAHYDQKNQYIYF